MTNAQRTLDVKKADYVCQNVDSMQMQAPINRKNLVTRHNPKIIGVDTRAPITLGNGEFAVTVDATGLQTLKDAYASFLPLTTMSNWGWHTAPSPEGYTIEKFPLTYYESHGRQVPYRFTKDTWWKGPTPETAYLARNPHHFCLGHIGLLLDGNTLRPNDILEATQELELWTGKLTSRFIVDGQQVIVETVCHPKIDALSVKIESSLAKRLALEIYFPYGSHERSGGVDGHDLAHHTQYCKDSSAFLRSMDNIKYSVGLTASHHDVTQTTPHCFVVNFEDPTIEATISYRIGHDAKPIPSYADTKDAAAQFWQGFWMSGGAVELWESTDPRAKELERRIVLSQYLTAIQSGGTLPPQESGLMYNSWNGKFHLEMHYWHAAHFVLWGREKLLERSLDWYLEILPAARKTAEIQGYDGVRWPKCVGPEGINAPCDIEPFLIWQQPHPIYYAELLYRATPSIQVLQKYKDMVQQTANFMASFAVIPPGESRYVLGPPVAPAQEVYDHSLTINPCYELSYWRWGLETAIKWRQRLGLLPDSKLETVLKHLAPLPQKDGVYIAAETAPDTFENAAYIRDHPTMVASLGMLPGKDVNHETMRSTLDKINDKWDWPSTWGWDYPMLAMTAARLGMGDKAIDYLCMDTPKNTWLITGGNYQHDGLPIYLPGNGGLLLAIAMMAAGWDGDGGKGAPGFPSEGWVVKHENLRKMP